MKYQLFIEKAAQKKLSKVTSKEKSRIIAAIKNLTEKSINHALKVLKLKKSNIITKKILNLPHAYVIYDFFREKNLKFLLKKLEESAIYSTGRYGGWKYSSMQEAFVDGKKVSENIILKLSFKKQQKQHLKIYRSPKSNEVNKRILQ